jgi:hypothetical protein
VFNRFSGDVVCPSTCVAKTSFCCATVALRFLLYPSEAPQDAAFSKARKNFLTIIERVQKFIDPGLPIADNSDNS